MLMFLLATLLKFSLTVRPYGHLSPRQANITVTVTVPPDSRNRMLAVEVISETYDTVSERGLDGDRAPVKQTFQFRDLPPGEYHVVATLEFLDNGKYKYQRNMFTGVLEVHD